jgi:phenylacetate-coenzyme A ligase PaaK-like adenylate-forming protein
LRIGFQGNSSKQIAAFEQVFNRFVSAFIGNSEFYTTFFEQENPRFFDFGKADDFVVLPIF